MAAAPAIKRVLLVDDEPLILRVAQMSLQKARTWEILLARSGQDALATARDQWKQAKAAGHACTYWQQNDMGRWEKKA